MKKLYICLLKAAVAVVAIAAPAFSQAAIPARFRVTPGEGAIVEAITTIEIFGKQDNYIYSYVSPKITINGTQVDVSYKTSSESEYSDSDDILTYTLKTPYTTPGDAEIVISENSFYYSGNEVDNDEISWTVNVTGSSQSPDIPSGFKPYENKAKVDPGQGEVTELFKFEFWILDVSWADYSVVPTVTLVNDATGEVVASGKLSDSKSGADGCLELDSHVTAPGMYTLIVPEGAFYDMMSDDDCPEFKFAYYIKGDDSFKPYEYANCSIMPVQGTYAHLQKFSVNFSDLYNVYGNPYVSVTLTDDATGEVVASAKGIDGTGQHDGIIQFDEAVKKAGSYTLNIPAGAFYDDYDDECEEYKFAYVVDGSEDTPDVPEEFKPYEYEDVSIKPIQGTYGSLQYFEFDFPRLLFPDGNFYGQITLVNDETGEVVAATVGNGGAGYHDAYVEFDEPVKAAGRYTLVLPEAAFVDVYDNNSPEYKFAYIIDGSGKEIPEEPEEVAAMPADGSTVSKLDKIELAFNADFETYPINTIYTDPKGPVVVKDAAGAQVATGKLERGSDANIMNLILSEVVDRAGEYTVEVPARNITLEGSSVIRFNRSFTLTYTVEPFKAIENKGVSINPAQGEVSALTAFTVTFDDIQFVEVNGNFKARLISKASGEEVSAAKVRYGARTWDADVELETPVTEAGEYILVCEENLFYYGMTDEDFPEYRFAYVVDGSGVIPYNSEVVYSDPQENVAVGQLDEIVLTFDEIDEAYQNRDVLSGISVLDASGNAVASCKFHFDPGTMSGNEIGITLSEPVTADGTYTITLPRRAFTLGGNMSDARFSNATTLTYLVDSSLSVGSVAVDADASVRYFDLQGRALTAPVRGQVVIRVTGDKATKIRY